MLYFLRMKKQIWNFLFKGCGIILRTLDISEWCYILFLISLIISNILFLIFLIILYNLFQVKYILHFKSLKNRIDWKMMLVFHGIQLDLKLYLFLFIYSVLFLFFIEFIFVYIFSLKYLRKICHFTCSRKWRMLRNMHR